MQGALVRIAVDQAYGQWNAPVDPDTGRFVYVPIPESPKAQFHPGSERRYREVEAALSDFAAETGHPRATLPVALCDKPMHLDPDYDYLTYGDVGSQRGSFIRTMASGDLLMFYSGLRSPERRAGSMVYAVVGVYVVDEVVDAASVPSERLRENAHTRKVNRGATDIVVRAKPGLSGRCSRCIPIGEFRDRAYRVRNDVLDAWGGLSVKNGYIQRSARPPRMLDARRVYDWFLAQDVPLIQSNFG